MKLPYNARAYIMRASYDSIDNKQKLCGKINKDITFIKFFHSTPLKGQNILLAPNPFHCFLQKASVQGKNFLS